MNTEQKKMHPYKLLIMFTGLPIMTTTIFCDDYWDNIDIMETFDIRIGYRILRLHPSDIFQVSVFETKSNLKVDQIVFKH